MFRGNTGAVCRAITYHRLRPKLRLELSVSRPPWLEWRYLLLVYQPSPVVNAVVCVIEGVENGNLIYMRSTSLVTRAAKEK